MVNPDTPAPHRELFGPWLAALTPENVPAQIVLHNSSLLSQEAKARFRESFAARNSQALDALLGTTTGAASVSSAQKPQESGLFVTPVKQSPLEQAKTKLDPAAVAALDFWTPAFIDSIAADLTQVRDFGNARELMLLACNLPFPQVRSELHKVLLRQWDQGPAPFEKAGLTFDHIRDPGFLILAKSMPREEIKAPNRPGATSPKPTPEQQAKQAWLTASESFLGALNGRFYTASRLNPVRASPPSQNTPEPGEKPTPESTAGLPFSVHRGGIVVGEYHLSWPTDLEKRLPGVKVNPLVLHYVRIEGEERFSKVSDWYKRQLKTSITRTLPRGQWFDSLQHDTQKRMVRSVDVLITRGANTPLVATAPPESLTVEILWIEIPDPTA